MSSVLLRIAMPAGTPRSAARSQHDLALDIRDGSPDTLRTALTRLSERFRVLALLPPIGVSSQHLQLGRTIAGLSDALTLPGFSETAFAVAANRYLTRCCWQNTGLPTTNFSLIQFPSALEPAIASVELPARLSPLHYALPHLEAHILRDTEREKSYQLIARTLQHHALTHPVPDLSSGEDPRTRQQIRFSLSTDQLAAAAPTGTSVEFTLVLSNGTPQTVFAAPITPKNGTGHPSVNRTQIGKMAQLAIEGCVAIGIRTGIVSCLILHTMEGDFLDGIIPNYIDTRVIPLIEEHCGMTWPTLVYRSFGLS